MKKIRSEEHLPKAFSYFDKDGSGYIEIDELREAIGEDTLGACEQVILDIFSDVDNDKVVSNFISKLHHWSPNLLLDFASVPELPSVSRCTELRFIF